MKTSLAIVLATAALMFSAILSLTSGVSAHEYGSLSGKSPGRCGVVACPTQQQAPIRQYAVGDCNEDASTGLSQWERPVGSPSMSYAEVNDRIDVPRQSVGDGSLEPILLLLFIAVIGSSPDAALTTVPFSAASRDEGPARATANHPPKCPLRVKSGHPHAIRHVRFSPGSRPGNWIGRTSEADISNLFGDVRAVSTTPCKSAAAAAAAAGDLSCIEGGLVREFPSAKSSESRFLSSRKSFQYSPALHVDRPAFTARVTATMSVDSG